MGLRSDNDPYAAPAELYERFDFIAWLEEFRRDQPVVWLVEKIQTAVKIGHIDGDRYPSSQGPAKHYGLWAPAITSPQMLNRAPDDRYGYGTQSAALLAYLGDLQGDSSSALANLKVQDRAVAAFVKEAGELVGPERVLTRGRATLHDLGAWPWAVVEDGVLPSRTPWWTEPAFTGALRKWDEGSGEGRGEDLATLNPWRTTD